MQKINLLFIVIFSLIICLSQAKQVSETRNLQDEVLQVPENTATNV